MACSIMSSASSRGELTSSTRLSPAIRWASHPAWQKAWSTNISASIKMSISRGSHPSQRPRRDGMNMRSNRKPRRQLLKLRQRSNPKKRRNQNNLSTSKVSKKHQCQLRPSQLVRLSLQRSRSQPKHQSPSQQPSRSTRRSAPTTETRLTTTAGPRAFRR